MSVVVTEVLSHLAMPFQPSTPLLLNRESAFRNGFWAKSGHLGTHTNKYFLEMGKAFERVHDAESARRALMYLKARISAHEFVR